MNEALNTVVFEKIDYHSINMNYYYSIIMINNY